MASRHSLPAEVARVLRAEVGFGCAICGNPIIEYHHIIPWAERNHFEAEHMVAVCRNHHHELGKQKRNVAYTAKQNPINIRYKRFKGYLVTSRDNQGILLGNSKFINVENAITYYEIPLFGHRIIDGEIRLKCFIPDANFFPEVEVHDNKIQAMIDGFWDIEFKQNYIKFRRKKGEVFLSMDFRKDDVEVNGAFLIGGEEYSFSPKHCEFGGQRFEGITIQGNGKGTGIAHGDGRNRLLRPNYAMVDPRPRLVPR